MPRKQTPLKRMLHTLWAGLMSFWVAATLYGLGDELEGSLFPVIKSQTVSQIEWSGNRFCWDWRFYKSRDAAVQAFTWQVTSLKGGGEDPIFVSAENKQDSRPLQASKTTPGGAWRTLPLCIEVPPKMKPPFAIRVQGQITYKTWTPWLVRHETEEVVWYPQQSR